jgi:molybdate transport system substrate-binding protein
MDKHFMTAALLCLAMAVPPIAAATGAELKVLAGGSMTASLKELGPKFETATGHKLDITFAATPDLIKMTSSPFDLGVVPVDVMKNDDARAKFSGTPANIARVGYGVAVKAGAPKPDVSTLEALKVQAGPVAIPQAVARGEAELGVFLTNVLLAPGVELAGPFPGDLQQDLVFVGAVSTDSKNADAAKAFLDYLKTPDAVSVFKARGVTPG